MTAPVDLSGRPVGDLSDGPLGVALDRLEARCGAFAGEGSPDEGIPLVGGLVDAVPFSTLAYELRVDELGLALLLVALAPSLDPRFGDLYAALQDTGERRPSARLALWLAGAEPGAPPDPLSALVECGALTLLPDPRDPAWFGDLLEPDHQMTRVALGAGGLDPRLTAYATLTVPAVSLAEAFLDDQLARRAHAAALSVVQGNTPLRLYLHARAGAGAERAAEGVATVVGRPLLTVDAGRLVRLEPDPLAALRLVLREARLFDRSLLLADVDAVAADQSCWPGLLALLARQPGLTLLTGVGALPPAHGAAPRILSVPLPVPTAAQRAVLWRADVAAAGGTVSAADADAVAEAFRISRGQIGDAAEEAVLTAGWERASTAPPRLGRDALFAAARTVSRAGLDEVATRVEPSASWADLVLPGDALAQLREIAERVRLRPRVVDTWGFGRRSARGTGIVALFAGASGTGKTTAAEAIAGVVGLDLYRINLAGLVSKYIGETEKNLDRVFAAARDSTAILLFEEADALFGKRSEVRDAHDRYANVETAYLLQRLEDYDGCALLASNLPHNMDEAFVRRLSFTVHFPLPDEPARLRLWTGIWPREVPRADGLDLAWVAGRFKTTGGMIRGAAMTAAYRAAARSGVVELEDVLHGLRREYQKLGKALSDEDLTPPGSGEAP